MKTKILILSFLLVHATATLCLAESETMMMGVWKLNETKSKFAPGATRNHKVTYSMEGKELRIMTEGVDKDGKPTRSVWTGRFDERDYLVALDPSQDTRSYKQIDPNTLEFITKKESQVIATGRVVFSADGKTRTVTTTGTAPDGTKYENVAVYEKEK